MKKTWNIIIVLTLLLTLLPCLSVHAFDGMSFYHARMNTLEQESIKDTLFSSTLLSYKPCAVILSNSRNEIMMNRQEIIQDSEEKKTEKVSDEQTPLAYGINPSWAFINLLCTIITVFLAFLFLFSKRQKTEDEKMNLSQEEIDLSYEKEERLQMRNLWVCICCILIAILSLIIFIFTEDLRNPMIFTDSWTILMFGILLIQIVLYAYGEKWAKDDSDDKTQPTTITTY